MNASCFYIDLTKDQWVKEYIEADFNLKPADEISKDSKNTILLFFCDTLFRLKEYILNYSNWLANYECILVCRNPVQSPTECFEILNAGFTDIITWEGATHLKRKVEQYLSKAQRVIEIINNNIVTDNLVGSCKVWKQFLRNVIAASVFSRSSIVLIGESGTGKELLARLIHTIDTRDDKGKLVLLDCTTIVPELSGSEFFGHEKGSYTGSVTSRDGAFALADKGTLFLDEIGELSLPLQAELLRVIQEKSYKRVGGNEWKKTDFRLICATNRNLQKMVEEGKFRKDLYYRISDNEFHVPSLRERSDDITALAVCFLKEFIKEWNLPDNLQFDQVVLNFICSREYQGNIRELRQLVRRIAMGYTGGNYLTIGCVSLSDRTSSTSNDAILNKIDSWEDAIKKAIMTGESLMEIKNIAAYLAIKIATEMEDGDKQRAAERLNVSVRAVQQYTKRMNTI